MPASKRILFSILSLLLSGLYSCENSIEKINLITSEKELPFETTRNAVLIYSDSAIIKLRLSAGKVENYISEEKPYTEFTEGMEMIFYNDDLTRESQLTANYAIHYPKTGIMEARDNVIVINKKGEMLNTEHLIWDENEHKIYTEEFVKITTADEIIYGHGLEANEDFTQYKIKNIKGTIQINEEEEESSEEVQ